MNMHFSWRVSIYHTKRTNDLFLQYLPAMGMYILYITSHLLQKTAHALSMQVGTSSKS